MSDAINVDFPWHFDGRGRTASVDDDEHVLDMVEQLLFTSPGERVNRPGFGSGILELVFAPNSVELAAALQFTMRASLQRWLGDVIEVQDLAVEADDAALRIDVAYLVRRTGELRTATFARGAGG
jgi:phage baseplate assembly protein W